MEELLLLIGRIVFGGFFIINGIFHFANLGMYTGYAGSKNVPAPGLAVAGTGVMLLAGGLSVVLGFLPVLGLLPLYKQPDKFAAFLEGCLGVPFDLRYAVS
jgi:putative oxidoreductase